MPLILFSTISFCSRDIQLFKICKLANNTIDYLQKDSTKCAPQHKLNSLVTMATYQVPDLPNISGFSGHWHSILMFAYGAPYA